MNTSGEEEQLTVLFKGEATAEEARTN